MRLEWGCYFAIVSEQDREKVVQILGKFGLSEREIAVYLALLEIGGGTAQQLAEMTGIPPTKIYDVLDLLASKWLCRKIIGKDEIYLAIAPDEAGMSFVEQFKLKSNAELNSLIDYASELERELEEFKQEFSPSVLIQPHEKIKVLRRKTEIIHMLRSLNYTAQEQLRAMIRPPFVVGVHDSDKTDGSEPYLRGVKFTIILDHHICLSSDLMLFAKESSGDWSERTEVFYYPTLNVSLVISDDKEAALSVFKSYGRVELWLRDEAVVAAAVAAFDRLKEMSVRLTPEKVNEICLGQNSKT